MQCVTAIKREAGLLIWKSMKWTFSIRKSMNNTYSNDNQQKLGTMLMPSCGRMILLLFPAKVTLLQAKENWEKFIDICIFYEFILQVLHGAGSFWHKNVDTLSMCCYGSIIFHSDNGQNVVTQNSINVPPKINITGKNFIWPEGESNIVLRYLNILNMAVGKYFKI